MNGWPTLVPGAWSRFRRSRSGMAGLGILVALVLVAVAAPLVAPHDPSRQDLRMTQAAPSSDHWFGTDQLGRDQFARVVFGARLALAIGGVTVVLAVLVGVAAAALAVMSGRWLDTLVTQLADIFLSFPVLLGALVLSATLGRGFGSLVFALTLFGWAVPARMLRASLLSLQEVEYVRAARAMGCARRRVFFRHLLPNATAPVLVYAAVAVPGTIATAAALSYLGAGMPPGVIDWGQMIAEGQKFFAYRDFLWATPALALTVTTLAFVLLADGLRDALDPKSIR